MVFDTDKLIHEWGKPDERIRAHQKKRRIVIFTIIGVVVLGIAFLVVNNLLGLIFRPIADVHSVPASSAEWAMFGNNPLHSASPDAVLAESLKSVTSIFKGQKAINTSPVIAGGIAYIGSRDANLYAIDLSTGAVRWKFTTGSWVESSPAVGNNTGYFGSNDGHLYALNAQTGEKIWEYLTKFVIKSSPAVAGGKVYFGCNDYSIHCVDAKTGKKNWAVNTGNDIQSSPAISNGILYTGTGGGYFFTVNANNGRVRNQFRTVRSVVSSPAVKDGVVYFATSDGVLYALDGSSSNWLLENRIRPLWSVLYVYGGAPQPPVSSGYLWDLKLNGTTISSPSISGNTLYIGAGKKLVAVDIVNRKKLWETETTTDLNTTPAVVGDKVYITGENGHLYVFNAARGGLIQDLAVGGTISSSLTVSGDSVYITSEDGNFYRVN